MKEWAVTAYPFFLVALVCRRILDWNSRNADAITLLRFLFLIFHFPVNNYEAKSAQSHFLSYAIKYDEVVQWDIDHVRKANSKLLVGHICNLCSYWRCAFWLMIFTPGKIFDSLDEVVIPRWFMFIREPMEECNGFFCHAFPITINLQIYQIALGIRSEVYNTPTNWAIVMSVLSAEC